MEEKLKEIHEGLKKSEERVEIAKSISNMIEEVTKVEGKFNEEIETLAKEKKPNVISFNLKMSEIDIERANERIKVLEQYKGIGETIEENGWDIMKLKDDDAYFIGLKEELEQKK